MSQIIDSMTIQQELNMLNANITKMADAKSALVKFILSSLFLEDFRQFNRLLHEWVSSLIILLKDVETPVIGEAARLPTQPLYITSPQNQNQPVQVNLATEAATKLESVHLNLAQAAIVVIVNFAVAFVTVMLKGPLILPIIIAVCSLILTFGEQIAEVIKSLLRKKGAEVAAQDLRHWISKSVAMMRRDYTRRRFLIMQQRVSKHKVQVYKPAENEALYDLKVQSEETLAQDFLSKIDWVDTECNDAAFKRKQFLLSLLEKRQVTQPMPVLSH